MSNDKKWALNVALVSDKKTVKKILAELNELEENGNIEDLTGIEGPFSSLQHMLKRRVENLALKASTKTSPTQIGLTPQASDESDDEWFEDESDDEWFEDESDDESEEENE